MDLIKILLIVLIVCALFGGGYGYHSGTYNGGIGIGFGGLLLIVLIVLLLR
jgi:hypothetical protein